MAFRTPSQLVRRVCSGRHVSIRLLIVTLVSLPVMAVGLSGGISIASATRLAHAAQARRATIRLVAQVDAARTAAESLSLPSIASEVAANPALAAQFDIPSSILPKAQAVYPAAEVARQRQAAVRLLQAVDLKAAPAPLAVAVTNEIRALQAPALDGVTASYADVVNGYADQVALVQQISDAEDAVSTRLVAGGEGTDELNAVEQLQSVVDLVTLAGDEVPNYLALAVGAQPLATYRADWKDSWAAFQGAVANADRVLRGPLRTSWSDIEASAAYGAVEQVVDPTAQPGSGQPTAASLVQVSTSDAARGQALTGLLHQAIGAATTAADNEHADASEQLWAWAALTGGLIVASLLLALLAGRAISRPVRRLADEADRVSRGTLVEVVPAGPIEVRRAGRALKDTVDSLRRVEAQATEVAAGRLSSPLLSEPLAGPLGEAVHGSISRIIEAIHQRETLQSELAHQAAHDPLTALPNRAAALQLIDAALARSVRAGQLLGLLFVDLDGFKAINDGHGHAAGDHTLQLVAKRLTGCVRAGDTVCRLGGDEFVVVVEDPDSELTIVETARRIVAMMSAPFELGDIDAKVGASVGVAISSDATSTADSLLAEADAAVYQAKASGRNRVEVFDQALRATLARQAELERAIREGLAGHQFALHYQPVIDVETGAVRSYEALVRWHRPGHGMVMPNDFIPVAESSSLICELGRWVLLEATTQLSRWTDELPPGLPLPSVAVNVSGRQLASTQLIDDVREALTASGVDPSRLILELTESVLVADSGSIDRLHALKALGVRVALDDFGTGYTSIGQLGRFPLDTLKIDRSFIAMLSTSDKLVQTMIQMAHTFHLDVVAEGVEDHGQLAALRLLDCDAAQGFLFARPQPPGRLADATGVLAGTGDPSATGV